MNSTSLGINLSKSINVLKQQWISFKELLARIFEKNGNRYFDSNAFFVKKN
jgi:hypothetical protein